MPQLPQNIFEHGGTSKNEKRQLLQKIDTYIQISSISLGHVSTRHTLQTHPIKSKEKRF